jgi:hypothetical protein
VVLLLGVAVLFQGAQRELAPTLPASSGGLPVQMVLAPSADSQLRAEGGGDVPRARDPQSP